jgi:hypothetical protein
VGFKWISQVPGIHSQYLTSCTYLCQLFKKDALNKAIGPFQVINDWKDFEFNHLETARIEYDGILPVVAGFQCPVCSHCSQNKQWTISHLTKMHGNNLSEKRLNVRTCNSSTHAYTKPHYMKIGTHNSTYHIYAHAKNGVN